MNDFVKNTLYILFLVSFGYFATDIYLPSLPAISDYFEVSDLLTKMTLLSFILSFSISPLVFGPLSDTNGRRTIAIAGLWVSFISSLGCMLAPHISVLIGFRLFQGVGAGAVVIAGRAIVSDKYRGKEFARQLTYITMCMPIILSIAPTIGGFLQGLFNWQAVFLFLSLYVAAILLVTYYRHESFEVTRRRGVGEVLAVYYTLLTHRKFMFYGLGLVLPAVGLFAYLTISSFLFQDKLGLTAAEYGLLSLFFGGTIFFTSIINSKLLNYFPPNRLVLGGSVIVMFSGVLLIGVYFFDILSVNTLLIPNLIYFTCLPLVCANSASNSLNAIEEHLGSANAILTCLQFLAGVVGCLLFSILPTGNTLYLGLSFLLIGIAIFLLNLMLQDIDK
jgi:Bcr/CflA subfamily drug resistance transporter